MTARSVRIDDKAASVNLVLTKVAQAVSELRAIGADVYLVEQGPMYPESVSEYLFQHLRSGGGAPLTVSRAEHLSTIAGATLLRESVDTYIETVDFFCDASLCPSFDREGHIVIYDKNHLTRRYSASLARIVMGQIVP